MADVNTGDNGLLRMEAWVTSTNTAANTNNYHWKLSLWERSSGGYGWSNSVAASVEVLWDGGGYLIPWQGNFSFDFTPAGAQGVVIAEGDLNDMGNLNNGSSRVFTFRGNIGNSGTSTVGGPASVSQNVAGNPTVRVPNAPTSCAATRSSDTQASVTWSQSNPANGAASSNQVDSRVNGGSWQNILSIGATNSTTAAIAANQKIEFRVKAKNSAGSSAYSNTSAPIYTTPGAPTDAAASKDASGNITLMFKANVAYSEHTHEVWHGTVAGGVVTWDASALTTLASGVVSYVHTAPNAAQVHVYRVRAKAGTLASDWSQSNNVQLLAAPAKPTIPAMASAANRSAVFRLPWVHNSVDSSPQSKYQYRWSTNGGTTWTTGAKTASANQYYDFAANTWSANASVTFQVRTKGTYDSGSDGDASYSPWSDSAVVTFKSLPSTSIVSPATSSTISESTIKVTVGFSQAEAATFVKAQLELVQAGATIETAESVNQVGIALATTAQNGSTYTIQARVQDSNGLWSAWVSSTINVTYLAPVPASAVVSYVENSGYGQIDLSIPGPVAGQTAAATVTITRTIGADTETIVENYPVAATLTFLDTTPTIHGTNTYLITTTSSLGATTSVTRNLVTTECRRAFLSKGPGFASVATFGGNLEVTESLNVASTTIEAAGRIKPIGLYGVETSVQVKVKSYVYEGFGSTMDELRAILLMGGKACFRDASGRRVFGSAKGGISYKKSDRGNLTFTITETS